MTADHGAVITVDDTIAAERGSVVVCMPVFARDDADPVAQQALATARSVIEHIDASTLLLVAGARVAVQSIVGDLDAPRARRLVLGLAVESPTSKVDIVNAAIRVASPADVVIVDAGIRFYLAWFESLQAAALSDSIVASATPLFQGDSAEQAGLVAAARPRLHPRIATMGPGCVYIRRQALDLAGPLEESPSLDEALAASAVRMVALGMIHVAADDVMVSGMTTGATSCARMPSLLVEDRNAVQETIAGDERGALSRAVKRGGAALNHISVTIDGRGLIPTIGGTQTYVTNLILALARGESADIRVLVPPDLSERATKALASVPHVKLLTYEQALDSPTLTDIVHRPQQVFTPDDLSLLRLVGERVVISQQDLIAYHNYSYHADLDAWRSYRRTTRLAMAGADQVVFFSEHARRDALAEDLLSTSRAHVTQIGAGHLEPSEELGTAPEGVSTKPPFILCLGANYVHKNRIFALELLHALRELGWPGRLVFAGAHVRYGSSRDAEQTLLQRYPQLEKWVIDIGPVDESTKVWLYRHTQALLYPTLYEGFGLLPLEAVRWKLPCLFAPQASLVEVAGDAATLIPWNAHASARAVLSLLSDGPAREAHLAALQLLQAPSWDGVVDQLLSVYKRAIAEPPSHAGPRAWQELDRENYIVRLDQDIRHLKTVADEYQDAYHLLMERVGTGLPLIDEGGLLTHAQQRGLMRLAARGRVGAVTLAPLGLLGRGVKRPEGR